MKEKLEKQIFKNTIFFFLYIFLIEIIVRINVGSDILSWGTFRIILSSLIIAFIISLFISAIKKGLKKGLITIFVFIIMIYAWVEVNLYFYLGFFMGIGNAEQGTKVIDFIKEYLAAAKIGTYLIIVLFIIINIYYWHIENKIKQKKLEKTIYFKFEIESHKRKVSVYLLSAFILVGFSLLYYSTLKIKFMQNELQQVSSIKLFKNPENANLSVSEFGVFTYGITDFFSNILKIEEKYEINFVKKDHYFKVDDYTRYINDDNWNELIEQEKNKTYNNLNNYFINREITPKNKHTGLFEGKNLIFILMESTGEIAINEELFPNIYNLYTNGMSFTNNYSPRNSCATGNNEMTSMTSLYTINNTCNANTYKNNTYFHSVFNVFNKLGYDTSSYHNYAEFYYSRRVIHKNLGSNIYRNASDLNIKWSALYEEWPSDVDLIDKSSPYFINEDKFMVYLTTVTAHQPYSVKSTYGNKNLDMLKDYDYRLSLKRYLSKLIELDNAIGLLINNLEEAGKLDDTVIVLFGDHYPYGLATKDINEVLDYDVSVNNEVDRTPLIIYNHGMQKEKVDKYTSVVDILPTLLNLFNIKYDPRLYFGNDIFSEYQDLVVFADGSWQNEKGFYKSTTSKFYPTLEADTYSKEELIKINNEINIKQKMSALAIRNNYFNYLDKGLNKYKVEENNKIEVEEEYETGNS